MKGILGFTLTISLIANLLLIRNYTNSLKKSSISLDELVLINSDVDISMLIENGYQFQGMPCGMIHYSKTIADTTFTYSLYLDEKRPITNWDNYPINKDTTSIYYPFSKKYIDNSVSQPIGKEVIINLRENTEVQVRTWMKKSFPYQLENIDEIEFEAKNSFEIDNTEQRIKLNCKIYIDSLSTDEKVRTLRIGSPLPFLDYKKKEKMREFREELNRRSREEYNNSAHLELEGN